MSPVDYALERRELIDASRRIRLRCAEVARRADAAILRAQRALDRSQRLRDRIAASGYGSRES